MIEPSSAPHLNPPGGEGEDRGLPDPHGGPLVQRELPRREAARLDEQLPELPQLSVEADQLLDAAKIATGAYSPLEGFMDRATLDSVLLTARLPNSVVWPMPILLTPPGRENADVIARLRPGDDVALMDRDGAFTALLHLRDRFPLDRPSVALGTYGTVDLAHPNVAALRATGDIVLAGRIELVRHPPYLDPSRELTPLQARDLFRRRGWRNVAGYQTRNVPHRGHEQLQRMTLERDDVDGLLIHPVVGPLRVGDRRPELVLAAYQRFIDQYYPPDRIVLATLTIRMRYAGPRAALFLAIVRKNFGCSHYIVGRNQAGVGNYYDRYACHRIFDALPIDIIPIRYRQLDFCQVCGGMASEKSCRHAPEERRTVSETRVRGALADGAPRSEFVLRPEIADLLRYSRGDRVPSATQGTVQGPPPGRARDRRPPGTIDPKSLVPPAS